MNSELEFVKDEEFQKRFWAKVEKTDSCWNWIGAIQSKGYGSISYKCTTYTTHRVSYAMKYGKIPYGLCILHRCDNRRCVNPEHLFGGTARDNSLDMVAKGRMSPNSGYRKLTREKVEQIRLLYRQSKTSYRELSKLYKVSTTCIEFIMKNRSWKE